jgi:hypothetical protein
MNSPNHFRTTASETTTGESVRADSVLLLQPVVAALITAMVFAGVYLAAFHAPTPHSMPVGVVGRVPAVASVKQALTSRAPGEFAVTSYPDQVAASDAVTDRRIYGAYVTGSGAPRLLYAGANGSAVTATLTNAFGALARGSGQSVVTIDVVPLARGDSRGLSTFYVVFGVVLGGFLLGQTLPALKRRPRIPLVIAATIIFGLVAGLGVALLAGGSGFGAVPASFVGVATLGGLLACSVAVATTVLVRFFGPAGQLMAAVLLVTLGGASSGAVLPPTYLPGWLHPLASILPPGLAVRALQGISYFHNDGLASAAIILSAWIVASAGVLLGVDWRAARVKAPASRDGNRDAKRVVAAGISTETSVDAG